MSCCFLMTPARTGKERSRRENCISTDRMMLTELRFAVKFVRFGAERLHVFLGYRPNTLRPLVHRAQQSLVFQGDIHDTCQRRALCNFFSIICRLLHSPQTMMVRQS
jgi:hypothetical protein